MRALVLDLIVDTVGQGTLIADEPQHVPTSGVRVVPTISTFPNQPRQLQSLVERLASGQFADITVECLPLAQAAEAHRRIEAGHARGKIVLDIGVR